MVKVTLGLAIATGRAALALLADKEDQLLSSYGEENLAEGRQLADALEEDLAYDSEREPTNLVVFTEGWGISLEAALAFLEAHITPELLVRFQDPDLQYLPEVSEDDIAAIKAMWISLDQAA